MASSTSVAFSRNFWSWHGVAPWAASILFISKHQYARKESSVWKWNAYPERNRYLIDKWTVSKNPDWYAGLGQTSRIIFICRTNHPCCLSSLMLSNIVRHTAGNTSIFPSPLRHRGRVGFVRHWNDSQSPLQMKPHGFVTSRSFGSFESISVAARYLLKLEVQMGILAAKHSIILTWKFTPDVEVFLQGNNCLHTIALALNATKCYDLQLR